MSESSPSIDEQIAELKTAGWIPKTPVFWKSPNGALWLGPHGAWKAMKKYPRLGQEPPAGGSPQAE